MASIRALKKEMKRCREDIVYFYNKYYRKKGQKPLTKKELDRVLSPPDKRRRGPVYYGRI